MGKPVILAIQGLSPEAGACLDQLVLGLETVTARTPAELEALLSQAGALLLAGPEAPEILERVRPVAPQLPALVALPRERFEQSAVLVKLARELKAERVLVEPLDLNEVAQLLAARLGLDYRAGPVSDPRAPHTSLHALSALWERFRSVNLDRVEALAKAARGEISRSEGEREVHKLVGAAGTYGFREASRLARQAEEHLAGAQPLDSAAMLALAEQLRTSLSGSPGQEATPGPERRPLVLVSKDHQLAAALSPSTVAAGREEARQALRAQPTAVVVLDTCSGDLAGRIQLLQELSWEFPQVPVLALTAEEGLHGRLTLLELGAAEVLSRPFTAERIEAELRELSQRNGRSGVRLLALDDDPAVLEMVRNCLEPMGLGVETLSDPTLFWELLELSAPDLILLDLDMPCVSGLDLCRALRADPRYNDRPVLFLSAEVDPATIQRIFEAGADDYITKPLVASALVTRVSNRLARTRQYRRLADTDPLTGTATRRRGQRDLERLLGLARRHQTPFSVALLDLDHFKQVNDRYGHGVGDLTLRVTGRLLLSSFRGEDTVARWGGEEFVIGLFGSTAGDAVRRMQECLETLRAEDIPAGEGEFFRITFSAGVAEHPRDGEQLDELLRAADGALYHAKDAGRCQVMAAGGEGESAARRVDVALVEDDEALGAVVVHACEARGLKVTWFRNGAEAARALLEQELSARVVLLDEDLPGIKGTELMARGLAERSRVLLMTARLSESEIAEALERGGAYDYIPKPFALSALMRRLDFALHGR